MSDALIVSISNGVAELRFNRPERLNALDVELAEVSAPPGIARHGGFPRSRALSYRLRRDAPSWRAVTNHFKHAEDKREAAAQLIGPMHGAMKQLAEFPQIVIGSLKGAVAGAGMSLALCADLAIAADDVTFNLAYAGVAASPDCGGSWALPRLVGYRRALEIALLSETIKADEAFRLGLVNRVVSRETLENGNRPNSLPALLPVRRCHSRPSRR